MIYDLCTGIRCVVSNSGSVACKASTLHIVLSQEDAYMVSLLVLKHVHLALVSQELVKAFIFY